MTMTMRYASEAEGPLTFVLKSGQQLKAAYTDGGGLDTQTGVYYVHGELLDGGFLNVPQQEVERCLDAKGEEVEFGNPWQPGHPRPRPFDEGLA